MSLSVSFPLKTWVEHLREGLSQLISLEEYVPQLTTTSRGFTFKLQFHLLSPFTYLTRMPLLYPQPNQLKVGYSKVLNETENESEDESRDKWEAKTNEGVEEET
ncbi:hypothetical protein ACH5RR_037457 [Cinchona calisaya]|uniref:Uncharacterized protein n=1 Tax=Cinchona calisaya TaxID=153742 RepID=A0ABD2Y690_9GENT